jgi:hypothetical protein
VNEIVFPKWPAPRRAAALQIYELGRPVVDERSLRKVASSFGLPARAKTGRLEIDDQKLRYSVGSQMVTQYRASGAVRYQDGARWQVDDGYSNVRIAEDKAVAIARRYMAAHAIAPLKECELAGVTRLRVGIANIEGDEHEERVIDMGIVFRRVVDGQPVDGPGGQVMVYVDAAGEVTGVDRTWRPIRRVLRRIEALRSADQLAQRMRRYFGDAAYIDVDDVRLGHFEQGRRTLQKMLQPAYVVMVGLRVGEEGLRRRSVFVQPAATNSIGVLQPAPSQHAAQKRRVKGK